jgi:hypothetical protein
MFTGRRAEDAQKTSSTTEENEEEARDTPSAQPALTDRSAPPTGTANDEKPASDDPAPADALAALSLGTVPDEDPAADAVTATPETDPATATSDPAGAASDPATAASDPAPDDTFVDPTLNPVIHPHLLALEEAGGAPLFVTEQLHVDRRLLVNRKRQLQMYRVWMQGVFRKL